MGSRRRRGDYSSASGYIEVDLLDQARGDEMCGASCAGIAFEDRGLDLHVISGLLERAVANGGADALDQQPGHGAGDGAAEERLT